NALNPALGRRGNAVWLGTGSLVRTDALRDVRFDASPVLEAHWLAGVALLAAGWRVTAPADPPVVALRPVQSEQSVAEDREQRARAARRMVFGPGGVLRSGSFSLSQRVAVAAWAVRPLSGLRRVVFLALLGSAILAGSVPFHATATVVVCGWLPAFVYTSLGLALLSGWTLRPGDRARWSLHSMGAACRSLRSARERPASRAPIIALPSPQYGAGLVIAVVGLSVVLVLRGISDRLTHTLGELPQAQLMALLIVTLWALALSLDLLRVLVRRSQLRRTARVASSLPATLGERAVSIVDLTALGAGLLSQTGVEVNERLLLDSTIPTRSGITTMRVRCMVRNVSRRTDGDFRIGVEFADTNDATANALAEFCTIEPVWERLGTLPAGEPIGELHLTYVDEPETQPASGRMAVRLVALLALVGVAASSVPATVDASASMNHRISGIVLAVAAEPGTANSTTTSTPDPTSTPDTAVDTTLELDVTTVAPEVSIGDPAPVPGAVIVAVCSLAAGADGAWGTADDHYGSPVSAMTEPDGTYQLSLVGEACWATVAPPELLTDPNGGEVVLSALDVSSTSTTPTTVQRVVLQRAGTDVVVPAPVPTPEAPDQPTLSKLSSLVLLNARGRTVGRVTADAVRGLQFSVEKDSSLPTPAKAQLATATTVQRSTLSVFVLSIASLLALSIMLGLARPRSAGAKRLHGS
ncbi:MAG TPA: PilZ domain-containing protein, partial [Ilumatobacteraceae bacterium]|nr:PilZ domain-containing protein [Ilumatobacteraceae bacterium]